MEKGIRFEHLNCQNRIHGRGGAQKLNQIEVDGLQALQAVQDEETLQRWKTAYLGRNAPLMLTFDSLGSLAKEERPLIGRRANEVKRALESALAEREEGLRKAALERTLHMERLDVTLPGRTLPRGRLHPATRTLRRIYAIFAEMGFQVYRSREVETDEYNFQLLNFPPHHPAREMQDSYYIHSPGSGDNPMLLRTHTSPGQIRAMREYSAANPHNPPPVRIILPGMCYRYEQVNARYEVQFNQIEGLAVGEEITFSELKGTLSDR